MKLSFESIFYILILLDSISVNLVAWFGEKWYSKNFRIFSRYFPMAKGWAAYYLALVLWLGWALMRNGVL